MQTNELRRRFLSFFEGRGHRIVPSDSLIPSGDPTVLFTSAGMNQFKDAFLGKRTELARAASCQKCLRTGDLDRVGRTPSHHSFFEMLGNFSFGDYFKEEAIRWAWEFLTGTTDYDGGKVSDQREVCLTLPREQLWVSVYEQDDEAVALWRALGMPERRIRRFGPAENFWPANAPTQGPNGPCGPCSEIYFDAKGQVRPTESVEVWNLVFTQYDRQSDGTLKPLPKPNIDTGMGLERLAAVMQGVASDYETDLFVPLVERIVHRLRVPEHVRREARAAIWTVADHLRAIVFLLAEKLLPSNEGRGYVLRMLIRRAHWHGERLLGIRWRADRIQAPDSLLAELAGEVIGAYGPAYPELARERRFIEEALAVEERRFVETLDAGARQIRAECDRLNGAGATRLSGEFAFRMKDTYGYPVELLADIAEQEGLELDEKVFARRLAEQQARSRAASQFGEGVFVDEALDVRRQLPHLATKDEQFVGYEALQAEAVIQGLWDGRTWINEAAEGQTVGVVLDRSPFYGEAGGQIGDVGVIEAPRGRLEVATTRWVDDVLVHEARVRQGRVKVLDPVKASVDAVRRLKVARSHTATHLLHWALRKLLGPQAVQAGSSVDAERLRFDFSSLKGLHEEQRHEVEVLVNQRIRQADAVSAARMPLAEAKRGGALAMFGEKYGQIVRVVSIGDYSKELCGGTHLPDTGAAGLFTIVGESSIAAGTRRIEALVGETAAERRAQDLATLREEAGRLGRPVAQVMAGFEELIRRTKELDRRLGAQGQHLAQAQAKTLVAGAKQIEGVAFIGSTVDHADRQALAALADAVRGTLKGDGVVVLASGGAAAEVAVVVATTRKLAGRIDAGRVLKTIAPLVGGSGGGRPEFAQGGGRDPSGIPDALRRAEQLVRDAVGARGS